VRFLLTEDFGGEGYGELHDCPLAPPDPTLEDFDRVQNADNHRDYGCIFYLRNLPGPTSFTHNQNSIANTGLGAIQRQKVIVERLTRKMERLDDLQFIALVGRVFHG